MPNIDLIKLKVRRGTDTQRRTIVLDQGELGYTTDTKRVFVGDSATSGGVVVGNKSFPPTTTKTGITGAVTGDIVLENSLLYQLSGQDPTVSSGWVQISPQIDNSTIRYDGSNRLTVLIQGLTAGISQAIVDNVTIQEIGGKISTKTLYLSAAAPSTVGLGLTASNTGLATNIDTNYLDYTGNKVTVKQQTLPNARLLFNVDEMYFDVSDGTTLGMSNFTLPTTGIGIEHSFFSIDYGNYNARNTTFKDNLSVFSGNSSLSAAFGGRLSRSGVNQTTTIVLCAINTTTTAAVQLSSAGFITLNRSISGDGLLGKRIAIPIFTY